VARDLRYSNRFQVLDSLPAALTRGEGVDYAIWDQVGAAFLLTGRIEMSGGRTELVTEVHDVVYREVKGQGRFPSRARHPRVPDGGPRGLRRRGPLGHRGAGDRREPDRLLPPREGGNRELWIVDSDGENLRRLTNHNSLA
jgi:hypothetical protein